jgi:hypothetical protein
MTTGVEDIAALRRAVIELLHTAPFDDMHWPEMVAALQLAEHDVKVTFMQYGNFNDAPPPDPLP